MGGTVSPPAESGAEPRKQTHFGKNLVKMNLKSGLISVARQCMLPDCEKLVGMGPFKCYVTHMGVGGHIFRGKALRRCKIQCY